LTILFDRTMCLFLTVVLISISYACHPECSWQCDNPVCAAVCEPVCQPYNCSQCISTTTTTTECQKIHVGCAVNIQQDQCETDQCPVAELVCANLCQGISNCSITCAQLECGWSCQKPDNCPYPVCQLNCEQPACEITSDASTIPLLDTLLVIIITIIYVL
jgi:hypothetical protein